MMRQTPFLSLCLAAASLGFGQQISGGIAGSVTDGSGAPIGAVAVTVKNVDTNVTIKTTTQGNGSYLMPNVQAGNYSVTFAKDGFKTETHPQILVESDRTATVNGRLEVGTLATSVEVTGTPLLNEVDTTSGYVLDSQAINSTPLGTGSFTQLAILSPGLSADFLNTSGSNSGFGNQAIWANGQRDSSNSIMVNGVSADNLFNGKTTSQVASSRFISNTGQTSATAGDTQTSSSAYDSVGQSIPTPPVETLQEMTVNAAMYDASQGSKSGAHIGVTTRSGTNQFHGQLYDYLQNNMFNAAEFFRNASTAISEKDKVAALHYDRYGATFGGPIKKDKLFFFSAYQGLHDSDALNGTKTLTVPLHLTDDRSAQGLANMLQADFGKTIAPSQIDPAALKLFQAKIGNQYMIPTPQITNAASAAALGYDVALAAPAVFKPQQFLVDLDYDVSSKDRIAEKYIYQDSPTDNPFGGGSTLGFPKQALTGAQSGSIQNSVIVTPSLTWSQIVGISRQYNYSQTGEPFTATSLGIDPDGGAGFPSLSIKLADPTINKSLSIGPSGNFANTGFYQNRVAPATNMNWVKGGHTFAAGFNLDYTQLNIINNTNSVATESFTDMTALLAGNITGGTSSNIFYGATNRYMRATQIGAYANDSYKVASNLTVNVGVRWDYSGPFSEKYGLLTNFHPDAYQYNASTGVVTNTGLVVAGNNKTLGTPGVSDSTLTGRQWGFGPRIGIVWSPTHLKNVVVRAGFGLFYDRGEYFTYLSPGAGAGVNGPFGVTVAAPFAQQESATNQGTFSNPFLGATIPPVVTNNTLFAGLIPTKAQIMSNTSANKTYTFSGYDPANVLPYSENWSLDVQWQPVNSVQMTLGYVGNRGLHQILPIPFNQPGIATATNPINGETTSYGFNVVPSETQKEYDGGNTDLRTPFIGFNNNSAFYKAEGVSSYNALQFSLRKRLSNGLQATVGYTWSHTLDMQSGLGLFFNGNDPFNLHNSYGTSVYDRTHVLTAQYRYDIPSLAPKSSAWAQVANGWSLSGIIVLQSGFTYGPIDFSGAAGGIYYSSFVEILDPVMPLKPGITPQQAQLQGTTGINAGKPVISSADFFVPTVAPGTLGIPAGDTVETVFGATGRDSFRAPFQESFDVSLFKEFKVNERFRVQFRMDALNIFNHPDFDAPNVSSSQYSTSNGVPTVRALSSSFGYIQSTLGSPRILQFALHLVF
ncbi:MAG TPA: TonB-dependent receptor [Verrucomicrobiae bacterium]|nr:TonB-dependent receptor [Verrucomicrobiae bacterium]